MTGYALDAQHLAHLESTDHRLRPLIRHFRATLHYRRRPGGFPALLGLIVEQQLSVKAADTIMGRIRAGLGDLSPQTFVDHSDELLRAYGLSRPKIAYAKALAEAYLSQRFDSEALISMDLESARAALMAQKGIGRWTAEVYLMFSEGRLDLFPVGDIALREALGWLDQCKERPNEAYCANRAETWSPYRSVAAHLLWAWYGAVKRGEMSLDQS